MQKLILRFFFLLAIMLGVLFFAHTFVLKALLIPFDKLLFLSSYLVNFIMVLFIYVVLVYLKDIRPELLGYAFMLGSGIKFIVFFLIFYRIFKADDIMDKIEFGSFFIPYGFCLIVEIFFLLKILKRV